MERMEKALIKLDRFTISRKAKLELSAINIWVPSVPYYPTH
jgi:hypothetical protein